MEYPRQQAGSDSALHPGTALSSSYRLLRARNILKIDHTIVTALAAALLLPSSSMLFPHMDQVGYLMSCSSRCRRNLIRNTNGIRSMPLLQPLGPFTYLGTMWSCKRTSRQPKETARTKFGATFRAAVACVHIRICTAVRNAVRSTCRRLTVIFLQCTVFCRLGDSRRADAATCNAREPNHADVCSWKTSASNWILSRSYRYRCQWTTELHHQRICHSEHRRKRTSVFKR